jgi:hypothetical protein
MQWLMRIEGKCRGGSSLFESFASFGILENKQIFNIGRITLRMALVYRIYFSETFKKSLVVFCYWKKCNFNR